MTEMLGLWPRSAARMNLEQGEIVGCKRDLSLEAAMVAVKDFPNQPIRNFSFILKHFFLHMNLAEGIQNLPLLIQNTMVSHLNRPILISIINHSEKSRAMGHLADGRKTREYCHRPCARIRGQG
jgi:hypothetical protein